MDNSEKKQKHWEGVYGKYKHLENYCKIEPVGINDDGIYYHPKFTLNDETYLTSQADIGNNNLKSLYALRFISKDINIEIDESLLDAVIMGYHTNKDIVELALESLSRIREHINQVNCYTQDYVNNILIGNSIQQMTQQFINELQSLNQIVSFMQKQKNND